MPIVMRALHPFGISCSIHNFATYRAVLPCNSLSYSKFELFKDRNLWKKICVAQRLVLIQDKRGRSGVRVAYSYTEDVSEDTKKNDDSQDGKIADTEELELLNKPLPLPVNVDSTTEMVTEPIKPDEDEALEPFLKFFKSKDSEQKQVEEDEFTPEGELNKIVVEYYEPKPGDLVVGVVVSGNENKLDVNVGADLLGTMLTKEVLPLYDKEMDYLLCDLGKNVEEFMTSGRMGIIQGTDSISEKPAPGRPIVDAGTVLFAEVLGRTLSGRPLLSTRRYFRRIAWHRVRQIEQLSEPFQVRITEWNTGGLLTRIEGLRAFLPKAEIIDRVNSFTDLKNKVGSKIFVQISRINEATNDLILSEREAWEKLYLREGTVLQGTVRKIFPYGAQVRIGQTYRSGLLHVSNISHGKFDSVSDVLSVGEKVKVLVIRSLFPDKISLSIADLESEPGLFISDKEKVFEEAEEMASKYRRKLPRVSRTRKSETPPASSELFDNEENIYANWNWFVFQRDNEP